MLPVTWGAEVTPAADPGGRRPTTPPDQELKGPERMRWGVTVALVAFAVGACNGSLSGAENKIRDLVGQMEDAGIRCSDLAIEDGGDTRDSPTGSPVAIKIGSCTLEGAPEVGGLPLATRILIFEDESHTEFLPPPDLLAGQALVYGDTWEIFVVPADTGEDVQRATEGELVSGTDEFPLPTVTP